MYLQLVGPAHVRNSGLGHPSAILDYAHRWENDIPFLHAAEPPRQHSLGQPLDAPTRLVPGRPRRPPDPTDVPGKAVQIIVAVADGKATHRETIISSKYLFPYDMVECKDNGKAVKKGEAT